MDGKKLVELDLQEVELVEEKQVALQVEGVQEVLELLKDFVVL